MTTLFCALHISDLHFGDIDHATENASLDAETPEWIRLHALFDGYLGHSGVAIRQLSQLWRDLKDEEPVEPQLIVTGDLTTCGSTTELRTVRDYIETTIKSPNSGRPVGLRAGPIGGLAIVPGNHDYWRGSRARSPIDMPFLGGPNPLLATMLGPYPQSTGIYKLGEGRRLRIAAVDTDAEVDPKCGIRRPLARGHFPNQCADLERQLGSRPEGEIRVLIMHHSPVNKRIPLGISKASRVALDRLVAQCDIQVLLTGHLHTAWLPGAVPHEVRAGTATAIDYYPKGWGISGLRMRDQNSVIVHRLEQDSDGGVYWTSQLWFRQRSRLRQGGAFRPDPLHPSPKRLGRML